MVDFLLLHGMCVDSREWERLAPILRADGCVGRVIAPDFPGRAGNRSGDYATIRLTDYLATAVTAIREHDLRDAVIVGHSGGGVCLQAAVAAEPARVRRMVFLCAAVPERGRSLLDLQPAPLRLLSRLMMRLFRMESRGIRPNRRLARRALCEDVRPEDCHLILDSLVPEPVALVRDRIGWDATRVTAPATYVVTRRDRVIRPKDQRRMAAHVPHPEIVTLDMGHARPVLEPEPLASLLLRYVD